MVTKLGNARIRLRLDALEGRDCPAVFTIANGDVDALNDAIETANSNGVNDTINLAVGGTYTLTEEYGEVSGAGVAPITSDTREGTATVTINGRGATIMREIGGDRPEFRILYVESGAFLRLNDVTVQNGAAGFGQEGGGLFVEGGADVRNCLFTGNEAGFGGGAISFCYESDESFVWNSTFTNNSNFHTSDWGGGGAIFVDSTAAGVTITNCTIAGNYNYPYAEEGYFSSYGGGLRSNGNAELVNTILADNFDDDEPNDLANDLFGGDADTVVAARAEEEFQARNSIIEFYDGVTIAGPNNKLGVDPQLRFLANNGGQSQTMSLRSTSPAINAGDNAFFYANVAKSFDQRGKGFARRLGARIDIGAVEFTANTKVTLTSSLNPSQPRTTVTFTATVSLIGGQGSPPIGSVVFKVRGKVVGSQPLVAGMASLPVPFAVRGRYLVTAEFVPSEADERQLDASVASLIQNVGSVNRSWLR